MRVTINAKPSRKNGHDYLRIMSQAVVQNVKPGYPRREVTGLWDTGATNTYIPMELAQRLELPLGDECNVSFSTADTPARFCRFYLRFPDGIICVNDGVAVPGMTEQLIIGMDVMRHGEVAMHPDGSGGVVFTFSI
jgi:hypothetical protein